MNPPDDICRCCPENECKQRTECARFTNDKRDVPWISVSDFSHWLEYGMDCVMFIRDDK